MPEALTAANKVTSGAVTITLLDDVTIDSNEYNKGNRLYVKKDGLTIDLNGKTLTASNCALTITGNNVTVKNGTMVATPPPDYLNTAKQTQGSYTMQVYTGINVLIDNVTMTGGVNVSGSNSSDATSPDATVTITNCNITATNYYTVCAQRNSVVVIKSSALTKDTGAFFWAEKTGYSESGSAKAEVDSKISYEKATVTFNGTGDLYNTVGVAPIEILPAMAT